MSPANTERESNLPTTENVVAAKPLAPQAGPRRYEISHINVILLSYYHMSALYGLCLCITSSKWATILFTSCTYWLAILGITAGVHRLWSHRSYKAKMPLQIFLMLCYSMASQYSVAHWVRDHRVHHKYSDTDADPHNATRGFFYSHIGWVLVKKHPEVKKRGKQIDLSDIYSNPVLRFQKRHAVWLIATVAFILPTWIPVYFWNETLSIAWHANMLRFIINLHATFSVNSLAHMWGNKPYDKNIAPTQNSACTLITLGEGFHNYHHVFPMDYRAAELGNHKLNQTTMFIDLCAWLGLVHDRQFPSDAVIQARAERTGNGTPLLKLNNLSTKESEHGACLESSSVSHFAM